MQNSYPGDAFLKMLVSEIIDITTTKVIKHPLDVSHSLFLLPLFHLCTSFQHSMIPLCLSADFEHFDSHLLFLDILLIKSVTIFFFDFFTFSESFHLYIVDLLFPLIFSGILFALQVVVLVPLGICIIRRRM